MFNYTVYGVSAVAGIPGSQWIQPVDRVGEIRPVSRAMQVSTLYNRQAEGSYHHRKDGEAGQDFGHKSFVRDIIQTGLSTLNFLGTYQLLGEMSRPAQPEADFIDRYTDELFSLADRQSEGETDVPAKEAVCESRQASSAPGENSGRFCGRASGTDLSGAMGSAASTALS